MRLMPISNLANDGVIAPSNVAGHGTTRLAVNLPSRGPREHGMLHIPSMREARSSQLPRGLCNAICLASILQPSFTRAVSPLSQRLCYRSRTRESRDFRRDALKPTAAFILQALVPRLFSNNIHFPSLLNRLFHKANQRRLQLLCAPFGSSTRDTPTKDRDFRSRLSSLLACRE